jgi:hypothetical protein
VPFFIVHGTLLGWFRECDIIKHTGDVDIGIPSTILVKKMTQIKESMKKQGLR